MSAVQPATVLVPVSQKKSSEIYQSLDSNEYVFALVGHVGSGTSEVARQLEIILSKYPFSFERSNIITLKASAEIREWAEQNGKHLVSRQPATGKISAPSRGSVLVAEMMQEWGDEMRQQGDHAAVACKLLNRIRQARASCTRQKVEPGQAVIPDGQRRAYILDSLRHPAEVELLRRVYGNAFALIGVVCEEDERQQRIMRKFCDAGEEKARLFMERDAHAPARHGQQVEKAFFLADYFLDNSMAKEDGTGRLKEHWPIPTNLQRLVQIITHHEIMRPTTAETAMYTAHGAALRSACLSRQVGAALIDRHGVLIATGTNDVPKAGGGLYGQQFDNDPLQGAIAMVPDRRCAYDDPDHRYCRNTKEQNDIIEDLIRNIPALKAVPEAERAMLSESLRKTRIGSLIEFSRAVHAEMDALIAAGRRGVSTRGSRLFVTTFPCHPCARHLVAAGVDEVQYIEPYPKSRALKLHDDAITQSIELWHPPSQPSHPEGYQPKVLFRPFVGVSPRLYARAFLKDRDLKDDSTGLLKIGSPPWGRSSYLGKKNYTELEVELSS